MFSNIDNDDKSNNNNNNNTVGGTRDLITPLLLSSLSDNDNDNDIDRDNHHHHQQNYNNNNNNSNIITELNSSFSGIRHNRGGDVDPNHTNSSTSTTTGGSVNTVITESSSGGGNTEVQHLGGGQHSNSSERVVVDETTITNTNEHNNNNNNSSFDTMTMMMIDGGIGSGSSTTENCTSYTRSVLLRYCCLVPSRSIVDTNMIQQNFILRSILCNGKITALLVLVVNIFFFLLIWLPLYCLSYLITEMGVYIGFIILICIVGRSILRLIAFPGACSKKVTIDTEYEYSKYCIRLITISMTTIQDVCKMILQTQDKQQQQQQQMIIINPRTRMEIITMWKRINGYKNRVLGVFYEVLLVLYNNNNDHCHPVNTTTTGGGPLLGEAVEDNNHSLYLHPEITSSSTTSSNQSHNHDISSTSTSSNTSTTRINTNDNNICMINQFGNNKICGDIGHCSTLTSKAYTEGRELMNRLKLILYMLDEFENKAKGVLTLPPPQQSATTSTRMNSLFAPSTTPSVSYNNSQENQQNNMASFTPECYILAQRLLNAVTEMKDFVTSLKATNGRRSNGAGTDDNNNDEESSSNDLNGMEADLNQLSTTSTESVMDSVRSGLGSILPMLDPMPHNSIFGFDVQRGCMLSRYYGSKQLWVPRIGTSTGYLDNDNRHGLIDVLHFPAKEQSTNKPFVNNKRAVLYCSPNAGLIEVIAGMSLSGGNVPAADKDNSHDDNWIDYYTELGIDVYVFNYAGYGRSYAAPALSICSKNHDTTTTTRKINVLGGSGDVKVGFLSRIGRILYSTLFAFQPTPNSLRSDGIAVAQYLRNTVGIQQLIIHGESIGGMAAAGTARYISNSIYQQQQNENSTTGPNNDIIPLLLICDRTFCNLEALAQRLVGSWSGYAIRFLTPTWNMNVTYDFLLAKCPKILASDASDVIIQEAASLKSGVATFIEFNTPTMSVADTQRFKITNALGWVTSTPFHYRMADYENACVVDSRFHETLNRVPQTAPIWPRTKHISIEEAIHFAACCKRIGKHAKAAASQWNASVEEDFRMATSNPTKPAVFESWMILGCCDGLTGMTLGVATKHSELDFVIAWLCSCLTYGCQILVHRAEKRRYESLREQQHGSGDDGTLLESILSIQDCDFDERPDDYKLREQTTSILFPRPIPEVLNELKGYLEIRDEVINKLRHEYQYVYGMLLYVKERLMAPDTIQLAQSCRTMERRRPSQTFEDHENVGCFLNLHCGHNNAFSRDERQKLERLLGLKKTSSCRPIRK